MRSSLLSLLLLTAIAFVGVRVYSYWQEGPWELPKPRTGKDFSGFEESKEKPQRPQLASAKNIVEKNLFDPERGTSQIKEGETSSKAVQRISRMILVGTAILGNSRYAILQEPSDSRPPPPRSQAAPPTLLRLKLGDTVEGFKLSEVYDKKVVFAKGASKLEIVLDFSRKVEEPRQMPVAPPPSRPAVAPRLPRPQAGMAPAPQPIP